MLFERALAELRVNMRIEIARLHRQLGSTIIYVTHDQTEAMTLADRIVVLRAGRIEQVGAPLDLYRNPANTFVAGFIGSPKMNLLPAIVHSTADSTCDVLLPTLDGIRVKVPLGGTVPTVGSKVTLGIRPEHFTANGDAAVNLAVDVLEHLGAESYAYARATDGATLVLSAKDQDDLVPGKHATFRFSAAHALLFSGDGARIR